MTPTRLATYGVAVLVYLLAIGFVLGGVTLIALSFLNLFALVLGLVMVFAGFLMRPRFGSPVSEEIVEHGETPTLHGLVAEIAAALETRCADAIAVDEHFNASWQIVGIRQRRVLTLGLPLLVALEPQERVALIAHELAHERNGDGTRGLVVGSSLNGLGVLYGLLTLASADRAPRPAPGRSRFAAR